MMSQHLQFSRSRHTSILDTNNNNRTNSNNNFEEDYEMVEVKRNDFPKLSIQTASTGLDFQSDNDVNFEFEKFHQVNENDLEKRINAFLNQTGLEMGNPESKKMDYFDVKRQSVFSLKVHSSDCICSPNSKQYSHKFLSSGNFGGTEESNSKSNCQCSPQPEKISNKQNSWGSSGGGLSLSLKGSKLYRKRSENLTDKIAQFNMKESNQNQAFEQEENNQLAQESQVQPVEEHWEEDLESVLRGKARIKSMFVSGSPTKKNKNKLNDLKQMLANNLNEQEC